ncbi:MAG: hypothetical protein OEV85_00310 [Candidatus Thorarchaeota archaeon]|nr:hypothetical protein [Candidatus Thorarchaeota archaeon]
MVGKLDEFAAPILPIIWGSLRNLFDFEKIEIPCGVRLVGSVRGDFPVDAYSPIFLEISKELGREDLSGRFGSAVMNDEPKVYDNVWYPARTIPLPIYENDPELSYEGLRDGYCQLLSGWFNSPIPDNLPCAAVAVKTRGNYCAEREAQLIVVLLLWPNNSARLLFLEFFEGAVEDCISPEWYLSVSKLMSVSVAMQEMKRTYNHLPEWDRPNSTVSIKPLFLESALTNGRKENRFESHWKYEWIYNERKNLLIDMNVLLDDLYAILLQSL